MRKGRKRRQKVEVEKKERAGWEDERKDEDEPLRDSTKRSRYDLNEDSSSDESEECEKEPETRTKEGGGTRKGDE